MQKFEIGWGITEKCNMNCDFCYSKKARKNGQTQNFGECKKFVDQNYLLINSINYGTGENSIIDHWYDLIEYIRKNYPKIKQALTTNGYVFQRIGNNMMYKKIFLESIDEIDLSLDYCDKNKHNKSRKNINAFDWVMKGLKFCKKHSLKTTLVFVGMNDTLKLKNIDGLFSIAKKYGSYVRMNIYRPTNGINANNRKFIASFTKIISALKHIQTKYEILCISDAMFRTMFCKDYLRPPTDSNSIRILPDGNITPSTYLLDKKFMKYNITTPYVLKKILKDKSFTLSSVASPKECKNCDLVSKCNGGVYDRRYLWYNTFDERDPYCPKRNGNYKPDFSIELVSKHDPITIHENYLPTMIFSNKVKSRRNAD